MDEDIGMSDAAGGDSSAQRRRGRQARTGPMGERPRGNKNVPATLSDRISGRAGSSSTSGNGKGKATDPPASSTIDTLRLFLLNRYSQPDRMLNMENMAEDPILKEHKLLAPGQPGAPSNMAGAIWKLAKEMFPDVSSLDCHLSLLPERLLTFEYLRSSLYHLRTTTSLPFSPFRLISSLVLSQISKMSLSLKIVSPISRISIRFRH